MAGLLLAHTFTLDNGNFVTYRFRATVSPRIAAASRFKLLRSPFIEIYDLGHHLRRVFPELRNIPASTTKE